MSHWVKWLTGAGLLLLAAVIVGPFTFFPAIWPYLSPILPRPEAVPADAIASYSWKASGTHWEWQDDLPDGCAKWSSGADDDSYLALSLSVGKSGCANSVRSFRFSHAARPAVTFSRAGDGAHHCSRFGAELTDEENLQLDELLGQAESVAETRGERLVLAYARRWLVRPELAPGEHPCGDAAARFRSKDTDPAD